MALHAARPIHPTFAPIHDVLGANAFADDPLARHRAACAVTREAERRARELCAWDAPALPLPWMPHATGAMNAWALLVLTGPGGSDDAGELEHDWSPGLCRPARHLQEFPTYRAYERSEAAKRGHSWEGLRGVLESTDMAGIAPEYRLALWGVANLSVLHFASDEDRVPDDPDLTLERMEWVLGTCRPRFVLATPAVEADGTVARALRNLGAEREPEIRARWQWATAKRRYELRAEVWRDRSGATTVVCRANNHPSRWRSQPPRRLGDAIEWTLALLDPRRQQDDVLLRRLSGLDEPNLR